MTIMEQDKKSKTLGVVVTLFVHILMGVLLWLAHFSAVAQDDESGILVMVGVDAEGGGNELQSSDVTDLQPEPQPEDVPPMPQPAQPTPQPAPSAAEPVLAQDDAEAPYVAEQREKELKERQAEEARQLALAEAQRQEELRKQQEKEARRRAEEEAARKKAAEEAAKRQAINNQMAGLFNNNGTGNNAGVQGDVNGNSQTGAATGSAGYGDSTWADAACWAVCRDPASIRTQAARWWSSSRSMPPAWSSRPPSAKAPQSRIRRCAMRPRRRP